MGICLYEGGNAFGGDGYLVYEIVNADLMRTQSTYYDSQNNDISDINIPPRFKDKTVESTDYMNLGKRRTTVNPYGYGPMIEGLCSRGKVERGGLQSVEDSESSEDADPSGRFCM